MSDSKAAEWRTLWHRHRPYVTLDAPFGWSQGATTNPVAVVKRLLAAYRYANGQSPLVPDPDNDWWVLFVKHHAATHKIFQSGTVEAAASLLATPARSKLLYGFDNLFDDVIATLKSNAIVTQGYAGVVFDNLLRLAEALGASAVENPEQGPWLKSVGSLPDDVLRAVENKLGVNLLCPDVYPDEPGLATFRGVLPLRTVHAIYQAYRLREMFPSRPPRVCEIGGGLGRTAVVARALGITDYTLVDIPFTGISQGYYAMQSVGADLVQLPGEARRRDVRLMTPDDFFALDERFDVVINVDSLVEFGSVTAPRYAEKIGACAGAFLSINHEAKAYRVADLFKPYQRRGRFPYWMRPGYVEEVFAF